jgi:hypothetical protein
MTVTRGIVRVVNNVSALPVPIRGEVPSPPDEPSPMPDPQPPQPGPGEVPPQPGQPQPGEVPQPPTFEDAA